MKPQELIQQFKDEATEIMRELHGENWERNEMLEEALFIACAHLNKDKEKNMKPKHHNFNLKQCQDIPISAFQMAKIANFIEYRRAKRAEKARQEKLWGGSHHAA